MLTGIKPHPHTAHLIAMFKITSFGVPTFESIGIYSSSPQNLTIMRPYVVPMEILVVQHDSYAEARSEILNMIRTRPHLAWLQFHLRKLME